MNDEIIRIDKKLRVIKSSCILSDFFALGEAIEDLLHCCLADSVLLKAKLHFLALEEIE